MSAPAGLEPLRIATWNLHGFVGEGRRPDPGRSLRVIESLRADILALQEVDGRTHLGRLPGAFERLRDALAGHLAETRLFGPPGREYGHVLWSCHPIEASTLHALPGPGLEPRGAIEAVIATPFGSLRIVSAHFGLDPRCRPRQAALLARLASPGMPTVALGDFNEWRRTGPVHRTLLAALPVHRPVPTWPVGRPFACLDRVYASPGVALRSVEAVREAAPASDHLPLVAELSFRETVLDVPGEGSARGVRNGL